MTYARRARSLLVMTSIVLVGSTTTASGQAYDWAPWTFPTGQSASANIPGRGPVNASTTGSDMLVPWNIHFDAVPFAPIDAPGTGAQTSTSTTWGFEIDFTSLSDTSNVVLGLGNFAHGGSFPSYYIDLYDGTGNPMPLGTLGQIGSYDHTWPGSFQFNDDVSLNTTTADFNVTTVPGLNDNNSDILLLLLPSNVGSIHVASRGPVEGGDTVNIVIAIPSPMVQSCRPGIDAGVMSCPCGNPPAGGGLGCDNFGACSCNPKSGTLDATGIASILADSVSPTLFLNATGENSTSLTVFWTGMGSLHPTGIPNGAGVRCVTTNLKRLWFQSAGSNAVGGAVSKPSGTDLSVSLETQAQYGAAIAPGETRHYFCTYRDPNAAGPCGNTSSTVNTTNAGSITWSP